MPVRVHPAFFAAAVVVGIGLALYTYWSGNQGRERPHGNGPPPPRSPPPSSPPPTQPQTPSPVKRSPRGGRKRPNTRCILCLNPLSKKTNLQLRCTHSFHEDCLRKFAENSDVCPSCPEPIPSDIFNNEHKACSEKDK